MKKTISLFSFLTMFCISCFIIPGASLIYAENEADVFTTGVTNSSTLWPAINHGFVHYEPSPVSSEEEALSNIRSSQGYVYVSGHKPYDVVTDKFAAVFKIQWTEESTIVEDVPTTGGFFIGWDYIPTFSNTQQTYHSSEQKQDNMTVVYKNIKSIYFYKNYLCLTGTGVVDYIGADSADRLKTLADSFYFMAVNHGAEIEKDINFEFMPLTPKQCAVLNIKKGDMVTSVFTGGEADKAGIKEGDVVMNLGEIKDAGGFKRFFASGKKLIIMRLDTKGSVINYENVIIQLKGGK